MVESQGHRVSNITAGLPDYHLHPEILRNNVSIYMFQIPDSNLVPSYCRWQGGCGDMFFFLGGGEGKKDTTQTVCWGKYQWEANFSSVFFLSFPLFVGLSKITFLEPKLTPENRIRIPWWNHQSGRCFSQTGTFVSPIYPGGTDHIICPVPAHSKFAPFSQQAGTLRAGKVWAGCFFLFMYGLSWGSIWCVDGFWRLLEICLMDFVCFWMPFRHVLHVCHESIINFGFETNPLPRNVAPECDIQLRIVFLNH